MAPPREKLLEAALAIIGVLIFVGISVVAGAAFQGEGLSEQGAMLLVGGIVAFILLMGGIGVWLSGR